ncbi:MAG: hypothetical protein LLG44_01935 [Chloroflexi bacterium]|nr:hypothetical protein [Chloroflexota bacterium]
MAKYISVTWAEGITEHEHTLAVSALEQVLRWLNLRHPAAFEDPPLHIHLFGNWVIPPLAPDKPYWGTQWYINRSYDEEVERVITPVFLELVRQEPWQKAEPHYDIALLEQDLTDFPAPLARLRPAHYTLSSSFPGMSAILSVHRIRMLPEGQRDLALMRLVRHCLGHALGAVDFTRKDDVARLGLELHCSNRCVMRHADDENELVELARDESELPWDFCPTCTRTLQSVMVRESYTWN